MRIVSADPSIDELESFGVGSGDDFEHEERAVQRMRQAASVSAAPVARLKIPRQEVEGAAIGTYDDDGAELRINVESLIATRCLIQANSGAGKSYLIRKILEATRDQVQQIVLDVEGEFPATLPASYRKVFGDPYTAADLALETLGDGRSLVVDLFELQQDDRILFVKYFLDALMNAPRDMWSPMLIVIDEAHVFAPDKSTKLPSAKSVIDLATRGRKRGFGCILATQRLAKLHKDIAAECLNKFIGRTTLDGDMVRAGDELGMRKADLAVLRTLKPGQFYAFGPAVGQVPDLATIGEVAEIEAEAIEYEMVSADAGVDDEVEEEPDQEVTPVSKAKTTFTTVMAHLRVKAAGETPVDIKGALGEVNVSMSEWYTTIAWARKRAPDDLPEYYELTGKTPRVSSSAPPQEIGGDDDGTPPTKGEILSTCISWLEHASDEHEQGAILSACAAFFAIPFKVGG